MSSFSGRSAIIFRMQKVFLRLAAAPASFLKGFAKGFRGRASWAATFFWMDSPLPKHVYRAWSFIRWTLDRFRLRANLMSLERSMCWSTSSKITRHWHKCSMPHGQAVDCWLLCRNSVICGARATNTQCINGATAALNCAEKSRPPGSKSSESLLSIRCCFRLWFGRVCNKNAIRISNPGANLKSARRLTKFWRAF